MLCLTPTRRDLVFPEFKIETHVEEVDIDERRQWIGGMDFGMRSPFVMLWGQIIPGDKQHDDRLAIMDEYIASDRTIYEHIAQIQNRGWCSVAWAGVDPAGHQRSDQTGQSTIEILKTAGIKIRTYRQRILTGLDKVKVWLEGRINNKPRLIIHPRCVKLIESLQTYHFNPDFPNQELPVKDGSDHAIDALRYMLTNMRENDELSVIYY